MEQYEEFCFGCALCGVLGNVEGAVCSMWCAVCGVQCMCAVRGVVCGV